MPFAAGDEKDHHHHHACMENVCAFELMSWEKREADTRYQQKDDEKRRDRITSRSRKRERTTSLSVPQHGMQTTTHSLIDQHLLRPSDERRGSNVWPQNQTD